MSSFQGVRALETCRFKGSDPLKREHSPEYAALARTDAGAVDSGLAPARPNPAPRRAIDAPRTFRRVGYGRRGLDRYRPVGCSRASEHAASQRPAESVSDRRG